MERKVIKFRDFLADLVQKGEKDSTWRLFDDKDLQKGDRVDLVNWNTGEKFAEAILTEVHERSMGDLKPIDFEGHEKFENEEEMYKAYRTYYGDMVGPETLVKIIHFSLI